IHVKNFRVTALGDARPNDVDLARCRAVRDPADSMQEIENRLLALVSHHLLQSGHLALDEDMLTAVIGHPNAYARRGDVKFPGNQDGNLGRGMPLDAQAAGLPQEDTPIRPDLMPAAAFWPRLDQDFQDVRAENAVGSCG